MPTVVTARLRPILRLIHVHPRAGRSKYIASCAHVSRHLDVPDWLTNDDIVGATVLADYGKVGETR